MAAPTPFFLIGPNTLVSLIGLLRGPDKTVPAPAEDWRKATVDAVIPAYNEEATIILCLESLSRQTLKPRRIVVMDDGSKDRTRVFAEEYATAHNLPVEIMQSGVSVGKTPGVKKNARRLDGDVLFILDGDTVLKSPDYIEQSVRALYEAAGVASVCGCVRPLPESERRNMAAQGPVQAFYNSHPGVSYIKQYGRFRPFLQGVTNIYRDFLYFYLQNFVYLGQMALFGSIVNPIGCAVAYRRKQICEIFDAYEEKLGDNLTTSEDIFIGFALLQRGYRNVQVNGIYSLSEEPVINRLPRQIMLWSSSFLQSCYYFPELVASPFKAFRRKSARPAGVPDRRRIAEPYRQPLGAAYTRAFGRPIGWSILFCLIEKISFPIVIAVLAICRAWTMLAYTLGIEMIMLLAVTLFLAFRHRRMEYIWKAVVATPVRYFTMIFDLVVAARFLIDAYVTKNFNWRK